MRTILIAVAGATLLVGAAWAQGHHGHGVEHLFQADADNDGVVTRAEFDAARNARFARLDDDDDGRLEHGEHARGEHRRGRGGHGGHHGWADADANNDGAISRDEFLARPTRMFAMLDANNDGSISAEEQAQMHARHEERREAHGRRLDADGDHELSREEFSAAGANLFGRLDANGDGRVTREEAEAARANFHERHNGRQGDQ
ncbi:MAG: hypothetical protein ABL883_05805 [Terricaulis sp.]